MSHGSWKAGLNPFPKDKEMTKFKTFADNKVDVAKISLFDIVENTVGKGDNAGYQHFLLFPHCLTCIFSFSHIVFQTFFFRVVESQDHVVDCRCSFEEYQPMSECQTAQADMGWNFPQSLIFLRVNGPFNTVIQVDGKLLPKQALVLTCLQYKSFKNTVGKGEIARNKQFLLFPQCFLPFLRNFLPFFVQLNIVACKLFQLGRVQNLSFGKGLTKWNLWIHS